MKEAPFMAKHHGDRERRRAKSTSNGPFHWGNGPGSASGNSAKGFVLVAWLLVGVPFLVIIGALTYVVVA
jgi:hypothetical protein